MKTKFFPLLLALNLLVISVAIFQSIKSYGGYPIIVSYSYPLVEKKPELKPRISETRGTEELFQEGLEVAAEDVDSATVKFPLEINKATVEQLILVPKIGKVTGSRIVQYREHLGQYSDLEQLMEIKGIGKETYSEISRYLYLEGDAWDIETNDKQE